MVEAQLTEAQRAVAAHRGRLLRVTGRAGTGKTTSLVARYRSLVADGVPAGRLSVLCRDRAAADRFLDAVLPSLHGGFDALLITTFAGFAYDVLRRAGGPPVTILDRAEQWALVRRQLEEEIVSGQVERLWPTLHGWTGRRAFVDEVVAALRTIGAAAPTADEVLTRAGAHGVAPRWEELLAFAARYERALDERGALDATRLLARAGRALGGAAAPTQALPLEVVLVDDFEAAPEPAARLVSALVRAGVAVTVAANPAAAVAGGDGEPPAHLGGFGGDGAVADVVLDRVLRPAPAGPHEPVLVECRHPAVEPVAVAGELLAAAAAGVPWREMAVLVRSPHPRARGLARALARHGIPVAAPSSVSGNEPVVRAVIDLFRWAVDEHDDAALERLLTSPLAGLDPLEARAVRRTRARSGEPLAGHPALAPLTALRREVAGRLDDDAASLAHVVFRTALTGLVVEPGAPGGDDPALDAMVAFLDDLERFTQRHPHAGLPGYLALLDAPASDDTPSPRTTGHDAVTISSIAAAAGREWHTVVVAGCVEGELPVVTGRVRFFDEALLGPGDVPSVAERRRSSLEVERRRFSELACTRATGALIATAAPEPGVAVSRFVRGWPRRPATLPFGDTEAPTAPRWTGGPVAVWPDGALRLSASRLARWEDCPLRFGFEHALGARPDGNVWASFGSLVHDVLAAFLDPDSPRPHTAEELTRLADERWTDDVARYRPQREQARRELHDVLSNWFDREGRLGPDVLAVERRFTFDVGAHTVTGSIDRVDRAVGGDGIEIVDYKTSSTPKAAADVEDDIQLAVYHLAATRDPTLAAAGPVTRLRLSFLKAGVDREQPITADHAARTTERIVARAEEILDEAFDPSVEGDCRTCDFHRLCPLQEAGREVLGE